MLPRKLPAQAGKAGRVIFQVKGQVEEYKVELSS